MNWITEETTASDIANVCGGNWEKAIKSFEYWAKLKHKKAIDEAIHIVHMEALCFKPIRNWEKAIENIQNLKF